MSAGMTIHPVQYDRGEKPALVRYEIWCDSPECGRLRDVEATLDDARDRVEAHRSLHALLDMQTRAAQR